MALSSNTYETRRRWMRAFAMGSEGSLEKALSGVLPFPEYAFLRRPEAGMLMLQGRAGNAGRRFNLGEMLVTRCAVAVETPSGTREGHAYIAGKRFRHAEMAAVLDALMQEPSIGGKLESELVAPLLAALAAKHRKAAGEAAKTKVDFFTMVRGEDA